MLLLVYYNKLNLQIYTHASNLPLHNEGVSAWRHYFGFSLHYTFSSCTNTFFIPSILKLNFISLTRFRTPSLRVQGKSFEEIYGINFFETFPLYIILSHFVEPRRKFFINTSRIRYHIQHSFPAYLSCPGSAADTITWFSFRTTRCFSKKNNWKSRLWQNARPCFNFFPVVVFESRFCYQFICHLLE